MFVGRYKRYTPIGIDFGDNYLAAAQWKKAGDSLFFSGYTLLEEVQEYPLPFHKNHGCRVEVLKMLQKIRKKGYKGREVVFTLNSGQVYLRSLTLPVMHAEELKEAVYWEMDRYLVGDLQKDPVIDYITVRETNEEGRPSLEVLAAAVSKPMVKDHFELLCEAGFEPVAMEIRQQPLFRLLPFAMGERVAQDENECVVILDMGKEESFLLIANTGRILFARTLGTGTGKIKGMQKNKTVQVDRFGGKSDRALKEVSDFDMASAKILLNEIERSIEHFTYHMKNKDKVLRYLLVTGQGAYIRGLSNYFCGGLQTQLLPREGLAFLYKLVNVKHSPFQEDRSLLALVAAGASLRGQRT